MKITERCQTNKREPIRVAPQLWRRMIFGAAHEAKRTRCGVPTYAALCQMWWLVENRPKREDKEAWAASFDGVCEMIGCDPAKLRKQLVAKIEAAWQRDYARHVQSVIYVRRAMVLACAGVPTAISRQFQMGLVDDECFDDVSGVDRGEQASLYEAREMLKAG